MVTLGLVKVELIAASMEPEEGWKFVSAVCGSLYVTHPHGQDQTHLLHH
jgi:hypothetical protein